MKYLISFLILFSLGFVQTSYAQAATLFFSPGTATLEQGEIISVDVMVDTAGEAANAIAAYFSYPVGTLEVLGVETAGSVMTLFAEQTGANGLVRISGGKPTPGFSGVYKVASVRFLAKAPGEATLTFTPDAVVLRNSDNQDILNRFSLRQAVITIISFSVPAASPTPSPLPAGGPTPTVTSVPEQVSASEVIVSDVTEESVVISWKTETPSISKITYNGQTFLDGLVTTDHRVLLSNLAPDTEYTFQIDQQTNEGQFRTKAAGSQGQRQEQTQAEREIQDFFDRVPGGLITALILFVLVAGSVLFLIVRIRR